MNAQKMPGFTPDIVICVGGAPGFGWLAPASDEQSVEEVQVTTDRDLVGRYASAEEAMPTLRMLSKAHPRRSFRLMTIVPLGCGDATGTAA